MKHLQRRLGARHIRFLALGSAIGTGLFYGSASAIQLAGPAVILAYMLSGVVVYIVMRALGEMAVRQPVPGSFGQYASENLGPLAGFVTGWTYTLEMVIVAIADVTAFGIYMGLWFPDVPQWLWVLGIVAVICGLNLCNVKVFGEMEFWLSLVKIVAIVAMIGGGVVLLASGVRFGSHPVPALSNLWAQGGFFPHGVGGVIAALSVVIFAYGGIEVIGLSAGEAKNPEQMIPRAVNAVPIRILLFYVLTMIVLMAVFPWNRVGADGSPFVQIFSGLGVSSAANILNLIVISAAISAINSDIFGAGRMMYGMAQRGLAPEVLRATSRHGVPWMTVLVMAAALLVGVLLNYLMPERVFFVVAAIATFATVWVWLMILLSQIAMRRRLSREEVRALKFPVPWWPVAPWVAVLFLAFVVVMLGYFEHTRVALYVGAGWLVLLTVLFNFSVRPKLDLMAGGVGGRREAGGTSRL